MSTPQRPASRDLVVQTAFVGDLLLAIPLLKAIRERRPDRELWLACRKGLGAFAEGAGLVDRAIEVDKGAGRAGWSKARSELLQSSFDRVYCPHQSPRSALFVSRLRAQRKIGFASRWNGFAFNERVARPMRLPDALRQLALLAPGDPELTQRLREYEETHAPGGLPLAEAFGPYALDSDPSDRGPEARLMRESLRLPPAPAWASMEVPRFRALRADPRAAGTETREEADRLQIGRPGGPRTAFLAPGSVWTTKRWTAEGFSEIARALLAEGWNVVLFGTPAERDAARSIQDAAPGTRSSLEARLPFLESCELLAMGDLLVSNDSGAVHMASLSGLPTVAAFGPTTLDLGYRPWSRAAAVAQIDLPCRPCGTHGAHRCPLNTHACMKALTPKLVLRAGESALRAGEASPGR